MRAYKKYFIKATNNHFPGSVDLIISKMESHFHVISNDTAFAASSNNPIDKRLDFTACFLAFIKTLDEQGQSFNTIRNICLEVVTDYVQPKNKLHAYLKRLPPKLMNTWLSAILLPLLNKKVSQNLNEDGFIANIITDKEETYGLGYGIDILECGICKLFKKHGYEKYASILCEVDKVTSGLAGLQLIRTGTIALGAKKCDFRFKRIT
jgi:hypothetical protein